MKSRKEDTAMVKKLLRPVLIGACIGALCCMVVLLLLSAFMAAKDIPQSAVVPMAVIAAAFGAFIGGMVSARIAKMKGLLYGAACGLVLYLLVMIAGFAFLKDIRGWYALIKLAILVGSASVGGVIGVNMRKR